MIPDDLIKPFDVMDWMLKKQKKRVLTTSTPHRADGLEVIQRTVVGAPQAGSAPDLDGPRVEKGVWVSTKTQLVTEARDATMIYVKIKCTDSDGYKIFIPPVDGVWWIPLGRNQTGQIEAGDAFGGNRPCSAQTHRPSNARLRARFRTKLRKMSRLCRQRVRWISDEGVWPLRCRHA